MDRATLGALFSTELHRAIKPDELPTLLAAHDLIEAYFAASVATERKAIVEQIKATGVDANALGRLCRVRQSWQDLPSGVYYFNEKVGPHDVAYFLGVPAGYTRDRAWPVVEMLPTAQPFLTDPPPSQADVARMYRVWIEAELAAHPDALVLMPLLDLDQLWGPSQTGMKRAVQPLHHAAGVVNIDPQRVYLVGHSMSAHATWNLALHYPTYYAAFSTLAGSASGDWQRLRLVNLRNTLPVVWHDADDDVIKVDMSRQLVRVLRQQKLDVLYEETQQRGHVPGPDLIKKQYLTMRARTRELYPKQVTVQSSRPDTMFNRVDWIQMYQPTNPGPERRLLLRHGTGQIIVNQNSFRTDASVVAPNRLELKIDNVDLLRVYLNDQLIDFKEPIVIKVGTKVKFEGMVEPDIDQMLKDQVFLGRGWRYFTVVVDIDMSEAKPAVVPTTRGKIEIIRP